jgi:hypothetical protein
VVPGAKFAGVVNNLVTYMLIGTQVKQLPSDDPRGSTDMINLAVAQAHAAGQTGYATNTQRVQQEASAKSANRPNVLDPVSPVDPQAATHIATFCKQDSAGDSTRESLCRDHEVAAWKRLVLDNEFPMLSPDIENKCKLPQFPDSFVAKEACA